MNVDTIVVTNFLHSLTTCFEGFSVEDEQRKEKLDLRISTLKELAAWMEDEAKLVSKSLGPRKQVTAHLYSSLIP